MAVFLTVLKIIGIVLLCILGVLLLLILLLLFWPFFYSVEAAKTEEITAKARVTWLLHLIVVEVIWQKGLNKRLKILGIPVYDQKRKEAKAAAKAEKEKKKAEAKAAIEDKKKEDQKENKEDNGDDLKEELSGGNTEEQKTAEDLNASEKTEEDNVTGTSSADQELSSDENGAFEEKVPGENNKEKKKKKKSFDDFICWLEKKWDQFMDFLDRAPDKLADWLEFLPDKTEELIETIEYYDRLLNSEGTEWVIDYVKDHGGKLLFHVLPYRTDGTLDYCDEDPENVAKIYEYQAFALPVLDKICGRHGHFDILALQDEKKVHLTIKTKGRLFLIYLAWHGGCLVLNKKVKAFLKRLKREEE